ncbi:Metal transporter Nramp5 [Clarias magur]|uniref:Metal transporter Nramp5 n=1 Tax=Clarias magur TaxID=1594786 RepID=A0A8J4TZT7_CLAMG|nr:Metal transporter Nramp5 [Clarias magur]
MPQEKCPWWSEVCETSNSHCWLEHPRWHSSLLAKAELIDAIMLFSKHNMIPSCRMSESLSAGLRHGSAYLRRALWCVRRGEKPRK